MSLGRLVCSAAVFLAVFAPVVAQSQTAQFPSEPEIGEITAEEVLTQLQTEGRVSMSGAFFETGSATLSAGAVEATGKLADAMRKMPDVRVAVIGHTDSTGGFETNVALSEARAQAVVAALTAPPNQIDPNRLVAVGVGPISPIASNDSEEGRARNRRVTFVIIDDQGTAAPAAFETGVAPSQTAHEILRRMTGYLAGLSAVSFDFDVALEAVTTEGVKLQFPATGSVRLNRPAQFRMSRTGAHSDILLTSDGKLLTFFGRRLNAYAQKEAPESLDVFIDTVREHGIEMPGADLLLTDVGEELSAPVTDALYLGSGPLDGVDCEHLAFRTDEIDFQLWVASGDKPFPCRYVITSKWIGQAPQYQLQIRNWNDQPVFAKTDFTFTPEGGARKVELEELQDLDLLLPEATEGARR